MFHLPQMVFKTYLYGILLVGGIVIASNLHYMSATRDDKLVLHDAVIKGLRYGIPWPMTLLDLHGKYSRGEDWMSLFKP